MPYKYSNITLINIYCQFLGGKKNMYCQFLGGKKTIICTEYHLSLEKDF
jgi:hypothetical protein